MLGFWKLAVNEFKLYLREPIGTFFTLIFPLMMLVLFGSIYGNEPTPYFGGRGTIDVSVPAYMGMIIGTVGLMAIPIQMTTYRERGILRRYRATPLRSYVILAAEVVVNFVMTLLGTAMLIVVGVVVYNLHFEGNAFAVLGAFTLSTLSFFAAGFVIAGLAPTARASQVVGMVIFYPMLFLSGASIPLQQLPETLRTFSHFLPLTHVVTLLQGIWFGASWSHHLTELTLLVGMLTVCVVISTRTFRWE